MGYAVTYLAALLVFVGIDALWLSAMKNLIYRPTLGDMLLPSLRIAPAAVFYAIFPIGLVIFAVLPALKSGSITTAILLGGLFGALAYATYDLTNYATLRNWTLQLTLLDVGYGAVASAAASAASFAATRLVARMI